MKIVNMNELSSSQRTQAAEILSSTLPHAWPKPEDAMVELVERLIPENTLLAVVDNEEVLGWGGILAPVYNGNVFELHPLCVHPKHQRKGIGRLLVTALEDEARKQGGLTIHLGADDELELGQTSLANTDLYIDLPNQLINFNPGTHQSAFYLKVGYKIIGVMPDANGKGKPDIYFGKRL
jgi:aminoglycoside 6'-N-acetyltransferase I